MTRLLSALPAMADRAAFSGALRRIRDSSAETRTFQHRSTFLIENTIEFPIHGSPAPTSAALVFAAFPPREKTERRMAASSRASTSVKAAD